MEKGLQGEKFVFAYVESRIDNSVLWERHCHGLFELIGVLEGEIVITVEGRSHHLEQGQSILIPPLCYHTVETVSRCMYRRVTAMFDYSAIPEVLRDRFPTNYTILPVFTGTSLRELQEICQAENPTFYEPLAESLMIRAFYDSTRGEPIPVEDNTDPYLEKLLMYIDDHLEEKILLSDLAACAAQSKSSVSHIFQQKMNISPKQYILQKKLALADKMIRSGMSYVSAAKRVGYDNYSNFYRMYRKHFAADSRET